MGFAAEAGLFFWEERGRFAPKKGVTLHPRATNFREKKAVFFFGRGKGAFCLKKGCNAPSPGYRFPRKKFLCKLNQNIHILNILLHLHT
jgi:hypothetical protein